MKIRSSSVQAPFIFGGYKGAMFPRLLFALAGLCLAGRALAAPRPLTIDPTQSRIEVAVHASVDSFTGKLTQYEPGVQVDDDGRIVSARLAFHFRDFITGKDGRDKAMHTWQGTDKFPDGVFELTSLEPAAVTGTFTASGKLTFHGVTRDLRFPVTVAMENDRRKIDGEATIDTRDFGLPIIRMMLVLKVDPIVKVSFHLEGRLSN